MHSGSNTHSLDSIYRDHHSWLSQWLTGRLGCSTDAADLAQDTFVRLLIRPRRFDNSSGARAYLVTIAKGLCVDLWRRRDIEKAWLESLATLPEGEAPSAEQAARVIQALTEIDRLLRSLSERTYAAFVMAVVCGMTDREVAAELGVSDRMVRKYIAKAMLKFAQLEAMDFIGDE